MQVQTYEPSADKCHVVCDDGDPMTDVGCEKVAGGYGEDVSFC